MKKKILNIIEKYVEKGIYISRTKRQNYWWSKINIIIYNNGISKNNELARQNIKWTILIRAGNRNEHITPVIKSNSKSQC